jgi:hypothetical protein
VAVLSIMVLSAAQVLPPGTAVRAAVKVSAELMKWLRRWLTRPISRGARLLSLLGSLLAFEIVRFSRRLLLPMDMSSFREFASLCVWRCARSASPIVPRDMLLLCLSVCYEGVLGTGRFEKRSSACTFEGQRSDAGVSSRMRGQLGAKRGLKAGVIRTASTS